MRDAAALFIVIALAIAIGALLEGCAAPVGAILTCGVNPAACN